MNKWGIRAVIISLALGTFTNATHATMIKGVEIINQHPELPTGCEATALTMLLHFHGVEITKEEVALDMPKSAEPEYYGDNPNQTFIGNPFSNDGYGVYSPVILDMIEWYLPGQRVDLSGGSFEVIYDSIDKGEPVIIWATIKMIPPEPGNAWMLPSGKIFGWTKHEHALVVVGYDDEFIYINDPYTGKKESYPKELVIERWTNLGKQAVSIKRQF